MPIIVLQVAALVFERVESLVLDFPSATPDFDHLPDIPGVDFQVCYPCIAINKPATLGIGLLILQVIDLQLLMGAAVDPVEAAIWLRNACLCLPMPGTGPCLAPKRRSACRAT